ncbi:DUF4193 family protein [Catellatospora vulcania]|uniref:DUF4193 family protein n=1 Tax=Catellatospora vulcania TaxID=1460450 RepID=UPI0012D38801|nr:DUF4193 family protein [Catellatospora vulcania]
MATADYDAPRTQPDEQDSLEDLRARRETPDTAAVDVEEPESFELPGAEQLDEELVVPVVPMRADEFRCSQCFLVHHHSQRAEPGHDVCRDCA